MELAADVYVSGTVIINSTFTSWRYTMTHRTLAALMLAAGMAALAGCSSPSVITLNDGREIQTVDAPKYDDNSGFYQFKQLDGKETRINKDQIRTVKEL